MKRNFFAGLFTLLPFALTLFIASFIINLLTAPFQDIAAAILNYYDILDKPFLFLSGEQMVLIFSKVFVLLFLFGLILSLGFFGHLLFLTSILRISEMMIQRIPIVNTVYKATKEITKTVFNNQTTTFSNVVLAPFPNSKAYSLGLISQDKNCDMNSNSINVFIPTAPNPTIGYMLAFNSSELIFIDMKVDDAIKCIVSCGITFPADFTWKKEIEEPKNE